MVLKNSSPKPAQMAIFNLFIVIMAMDMIVSGRRFGRADGLSMQYYTMSCPFAEGIIRDTVNNALQSDPTLAAALIRMHFHDCFIQVHIYIYSPPFPSSFTHILCCYSRWAQFLLLFLLLLFLAQLFDPLDFVINKTKWKIYIMWFGPWDGSLKFCVAKSSNILFAQL